MQLIIVESPSKAKTIEKYLGGKYKVDASGGHVRDLPEKRLGVNVAKNYEPNYVVSADKKPIVKRLKEKAEKADKVYLATDPDREGEAISWHLSEALGLDGKARRIEFNEISEKAVKEALKNPRDINYNLVDSQQARRVLDRLVGYKLSPLLCKRIQNGLSAGRVQSVALRIIVDKEREIRAFVPTEYWNASVTLSGGKNKPFNAFLIEKGGEKFKPSNETEATAVEKALNDNGGKFVVKQIKRTDTKSHALPPFTTSTMQQDASAKLNMSSPMCMQVAQHLYEGIETTEGHLALITYIRTDSVRISAESQAAAREFIKEKYGEEYLPVKPNFYKSKKNAQDAHEAIRPIDLSVTPEKVKPLLDKNHYNLYKLVYERFVASQMSEAKYNYVTIDSACGDYLFRTSGRTVVFKGYTAVYDDYRAASESDSEIVKVIPSVEEGDCLEMTKMTKEQKFTKPPVRFTDASLVKIMEEKGIGRPSTYATIISVLSKRKYTTKEGKYIAPTEIAFKMTDMLSKYFPDVMDVSFTADMEDKLDDIENGGKDWRKLIADFYPPFAEKLAFAATDGDETTDVLCEKCGSPMIRKNGRYGKFLACSKYPECSNIKSEQEEVSDVKCDKCGAMMVYKTGRYGKFLACPNYPDCSNVKPLDEESTDEKCEKCGGAMVVKKGRFGKYEQCSVCKATKSLAEKAGVCPQCGSPTQKMMSKKGKNFYGCSKYPECNFMSWDMPTGELCPKCGGYIVLAKDGKAKKCSNKECDYGDKPQKKTKKEAEDNVDKN